MRIVPSAQVLWLALAALPLIWGCGGKSKDSDADVSDDTTEDTVVDTSTDPAPDPTADVTEDPTTDTEGDTAGDVTTDPEMDTTQDVEPDVADAVSDPYEDWPSDIPEDWPTETTSACAAAGGFCTEYRWVLCPAGYEPIDAEGHRGCGESTGVNGWCCVVAPPSPCSASSTGNCIEAESCTGCWSAVELDCEADRVCCQDMCD